MRCVVIVKGSVRMLRTGIMSTMARCHENHRDDGQKDYCRLPSDESAFQVHFQDEKKPLRREVGWFGHCRTHGCCHEFSKINCLISHQEGKAFALGIYEILVGTVCTPARNSPFYPLPMPSSLYP